MILFFSEVNGKNRKGFDGKKLYCAICGSFDHMLEVLPCSLLCSEV